MASDPTRRFSSRVENYVRYRPDYPPAVLDVMREICGFRPGDGTDYAEVRERHPDRGQVQAFFGSDPVILRTVEHRQWFDYAGLEGRLLSSSHAPEAGHPNHGPMLTRLRAIFAEHQVDGRASFDYDTQVYCAQPRPG